MDAVFDTIGGSTLTRSPDALAQLGRVVSIVDIAQSQNLVQAWGKNASYHFVFRERCLLRLPHYEDSSGQLTFVLTGRLQPKRSVGIGQMRSLKDASQAKLHKVLVAVSSDSPSNKK